MRGKSSNQLHINKMQKGLFSYRPSQSKKVILSVIILAILIIIATVVSFFLLDNERRVKSQISALATDYYENYFYQDYTGADLSNYEIHGYAPVTLRQLLLYDHQKNSAYTEFLTNFCDENHTFVRFYPESPYTKTSYRTEYTYSCNF